MSNLICKNCKSISVEYEDYCGCTSYYRCKTCGQRGDKDKFTQQTVFHRITASPEVLAEKLVYQRNSKVIHQNDKCTLEYWTFSWKSSVIKGQSFETKEEAIAATVARLNEVEK
jgi:hypothetical protein